jgi:hypothetical protein
LIWMSCRAGYISQTVKLGALGIPAYRSFSLVELEAATNNFEVSCLMGQDAHGQVGSIISIADRNTETPCKFFFFFAEREGKPPANSLRNQTDL